MAPLETDISQLSETQQEALQQYTAVTDQDVAASIPLLQRSQWNVQIAIAKFFDGEGPDLLAEAQAAQILPPPRASRQENLQESLLFGSAHASRGIPPDAAPRIVPQPEDQVIRRPPLLLAILFTPFTLLYRLFSTAFGGLFGVLFPFLPRIFRPTATPGARRRFNQNGRRSLKPKDAAMRLKREFEEEYGSNNLPFYEGGYAQALDLAKKDLKFLLILLISPEHDDTTSFISDTLLVSEVQIFLNDPAKNIIFWVGDVSDSEAYQVSTAMSCNKFPFTAVVAHTPQVNSTSMSVIGRITGPMDAPAYLAALQKVMAIQESRLADVRAARSAQNFERTLRQEQDSAYERSLAQDRERARLKRETEAAAVAQAKREQEEKDAAEILAIKKLQWRKWRASRLSPEPGLDAKDVVRIALKMPEAARVIRKFKSEDGIEELYAFVECYEFVKDGPLTDTAPKPEAYEHNFDFRLVQTLPRVVYALEDGGTIVERVGKSGNLIVEPIQCDDEEEED